MMKLVLTFVSVFMFGLFQQETPKLNGTYRSVFEKIRTADIQNGLR